MRLLFVSVRYGTEFGGGAEGSCRMFATQLAARGHEVHVVTTRARDYQTWADEYPEAETVIDSVQVHRLSVSKPRQLRRFGPLNGRVAWRARPATLLVQDAWLLAQGPCPDGFDDWLLTHSASFDAVIFFTYLYYPTWRGLQVCRGRVPTVLHPAAHDEPFFWLSVYDEMLRLPTSYAYFTEEERRLVTRRVGQERPGRVVGIGTDLDRHGDPRRFQDATGLGDRPYLLYVGRLDPSKAVPELHDFFTAYKQRHPGPLALVLMGDPVLRFEDHPDVVTTGFVEDQMVHDALAGCQAMVLPSYFESFSMAVAEAWVHRRPVLVQGHAEALLGQVRRSAGGLPYWNFPEFEAAVDLLNEHPELVDELGQRGRAYVEANFGWDRVMASYETLLHDAIRRRVLLARAPWAGPTPVTGRSQEGGPGERQSFG